MDFENNNFMDLNTKKVIISLLSLYIKTMGRNNGFLFFICQQIKRVLSILNEFNEVDHDIIKITT